MKVDFTRDEWYPVNTLSDSIEYSECILEIDEDLWERYKALNDAFDEMQREIRIIVKEQHPDNRW